MKIKISSLFFFMSFLFLVVLVVSSGYRHGGLDYFQYVERISYVSDADDILTALFRSKDFMFGFVILSTVKVGLDYSWVFLLYAIAGGLIKLIALNKVRYSSLIIVVFYIILFSPGLDFAAMRAMLGMSYLLLYITHKDSLGLVYKFFLVLLAVTSHISMVLPILAVSSVSVFLFRKLRFLYVTVIFIVTYVGAEALGYLPQTRSYLDSPGSVLAYIPFFIYFTALLLYWMNFIRSDSKISLCCFVGAVVMFAISLGFTSSIVVASYRFLQISQFLFLISLSGISRKIIFTTKRFVIILLVWFFFIVPLIYKNYSLLLWGHAVEAVF